jgi:hypothetical protein
MRKTMSRAPLALVLAALVGTALAQPVARPTVNPPPTGPGQPVPGRPVLAVPLSRQEAEALRHLFQESLTHQAAIASRDSALRQAGLDAENDAVEAASAAARSGGAAPIGVALAQVWRAQVRGVDPGLESATRLTLRSRLDRDPTDAEMQAELRKFNARIEQANRWLAANRTRIAKTYGDTGSMPPAFDEEALRPGASPRPPETAAVQAGFRALFRSLLTQSDAGPPSTPSVPPGGTLIPRRPGAGPVVAPTPPTPAARPPR